MDKSRRLVVPRMAHSHPYQRLRGHEVELSSRLTTAPATRLHQQSNKKGPQPILKTGRQRKRAATRQKGSEFIARKEKRRIYFCCISSELNVESIYEEMNENSPDDYIITLYQDVLHVYINDVRRDLKHLDSAEYFSDDRPAAANKKNDSWSLSEPQMRRELSDGEYDSVSDAEYMDQSKRVTNTKDLGAISESDHDDKHYATDQKQWRAGQLPNSPEREEMLSDPQKRRNLWGNCREAFIFDFGAMVLWGFSEQEEQEFKGYITANCKRDKLFSDEEHEESQDDMGFIVSDRESFTTAQNKKRQFLLVNDVVTLSIYSQPRQRLAISFSLAQSSVLAVFEGRIQKKVETYKSIPETFATHGYVKISANKLGSMIGDVFVIKHDVNLHTEILDTPDWFWDQRDVESMYKVTNTYLDMQSRTDILNKRLDMLYQLLSMLQAQDENAHLVKLEWIIILLVLLSALFDLVLAITNYFAKDQ